jgi:hypothetical protein
LKPQASRNLIGMPAIWIVPAFSVFILLSGVSGCSKWKREDASEALTTGNSGTFSRSAAFLSRTASSSNLIRTSGEVIYLRLAALFPRATQAAAGRRPFLLQSEFESLTSAGINRSLADENRPTSALSQVALRKWVAPLCKTYLDAPGSSAPLRSVFSESSALIAEDRPPTQVALKESLIAARNIWLDLFTETSPEVIALSELYTKTLGAPGGTAALARQAICMAALLSPQFLIGNLGPRDVIRRMSLEVGRFLPSLQDLRNYELGRLTLDQYIRNIQARPSYLLALKSWHRDWWGLREFRTKLGSRPETSNDPRGGTWRIFNFSELGAVALAERETLPDGRARVEPTGAYLTTDPSSPLYQCSTRKADGSINVQAFDPRSVMVIYEHYYPAQNRWEAIGAYVHQDRLSTYEDIVKAYDPTFNASSRCSLVSTTDPKYRSDVPNYYRCKGSVTGASGGFISSGVEDFLDFPTQQTDSNGRGIDAYQYPINYYLSGRDEIAGNLHTNALNGSVHATFRAADRRIRRLSPTGWQDGLSRVKTWWSGDTTYVCNSFHRFRVTCPFRSSNNGRTYQDNYNRWYYVNNSLGRTPAAEYALTGAFMDNLYSTSPLLLNQFRCGVPNVAAIPLPIPSLIPETSAYPRGFSVASSAYLDPNPLPAGAVNDVAILGAVSGSVAPGESAALARLQDDLKDEPFRLLEYVLEHKRPYSEMVTAPFTIGREELELAYRSHFLFLPSYPPGYTLPSVDDSRRNEVRVIRRGELPPIPASWTKGPYNQLVGLYAESPRVNESGWIPPAPASGILTMPAFLGPVSQKMRVISSRIFERLLCGSPNLFVPQGSQSALHERYMTHPDNPAPPAHMDGKSGCYSCHVNLDPLAAALSGTFLQNVQRDEPKAMQGQFLLLTSPTTGRSFLGGTGNSESGEGALLGQPAQGFPGVGAILSESPLFYRCTTLRAFEKVIGRGPALEELKLFDQIASEFQTQRDFNELIRKLVLSPLYRKEN